MLRWLVAPCVTLTAGRDIQDFSHSFRIPPRIKLTREERDGSSKTARRQTGAMRDTLRARIILLAADGLKNQEIAKTLGTSDNAVGKWRRRFVEKGITGLNDDPRPGRTRIYGADKIEEIVKKTIEEKPEDRTHWSTRSLNRVERFFGKITAERIRRGAFKSVLELTEAIHSYIESHNCKPKPHVRTKTGEEILNKLKTVY